MLRFSREDLMMYDAISKLDSFPYASGGEGDAFFINDKYVLKKYYKKIEKGFDAIFEDYCTEMKMFSDMGLAVPKIYAWTKLPSLERVNPDVYYDYYILEERVKGRQLYYGYLEDIYPICKKLCEKDEFLHTVKNPDENRILFNEILSTYVMDFQMVNDYLCSMPEKQIDKFLYDTYVMCLEGKFSMPDLYPANVILSKNGISLIDNSCDNRDFETKKTKEYADRIMTNGMMWLFFYNNYVTNPRELIQDDYDSRMFFNKKRDKVTKSCKQAMLRIVKRLKKIGVERNGDIICPKLKVANNTDIATFIMVKDMLSNQDAAEIYSNFDFER